MPFGIKRKLDQERRARESARSRLKAKSLRDEGYSNSDIANIMGMSIVYIRKLIGKAPPLLHKHSLTSDILNQIRNMRGEGTSFQEIGKHFGWAPSYISRVCKAFHFEFVDRKIEPHNKLDRQPFFQALEFGTVTSPREVAEHFGCCRATANTIFNEWKRKSFTLSYEDWQVLERAAHIGFRGVKHAGFPTAEEHVGMVLAEAAPEHIAKGVDFLAKIVYRRAIDEVRRYLGRSGSGDTVKLGYKKGINMPVSLNTPILDGDMELGDSLSDEYQL